MKFEVGEFAIVASAPAYPESLGKLVCIMEIDPSFRSPYRTDLIVDGECCWAGDQNLRKLPPREEPASLTRNCEAIA